MCDNLIFVKRKIMISSTSNQQMKQLVSLLKKAKERREKKVFVVEGTKMVLEAPYNWVKQVYVSETYSQVEEHEELLKQLENNAVSVEVVSDAVFKTVSDTQTPQGILAIVKQPEYTLEDLLQEKDGQFLLLESIQDPGNLGTMMRTGEGAGISAIIMNKTTVDLFNPKTIRSTMGSIYRVPFLVVENLNAVIEQLKMHGVKLYAAHLKGRASYDQVSYLAATAFMIGNEGNGLSDEIASLADEYIKIPMEGSVESLNAAISASILMYESYRQRRNS